MEPKVAERKSVEGLKSLSQAFTENSILTTAMDMTGVMILVVNDTRQIVYANSLMLEAFHKESMDQVLGLRTGEAIECIHAHDVPGGCGEGPACKNCSAANILIRGITTGIPVEDEVAIQRNSHGISSAAHMKMKIVPYELTGETCYILSFKDSTDTVRRRELERIFFHDILNATGAIKNYLTMILEEAPENLRGDISFLDTALAETIEDIHAQKSLGDVENQDYQIMIGPVLPDEVCLSVMKYFKFHREHEFKKLSLDIHDSPAAVFTDARILRRVLINMVKNALEATGKDEAVHLGYEALESNPYKARFFVWNPGVIDPAIQPSIFTRSFSTKGFGRGLGTYGMKLFGERYLGGEVGFSSSTENGTEFYISLPDQEEENP